MKEPKLGIAHYNRRCPKCGRWIYKGNDIINTQDGWICVSCYLPNHLSREMKRMDKEFYSTIREQ